MKSNGLKRKDLVKATGVPFYKIKYLKDLGKLKLIKDSPSPGIPAIYHPDSIKIIQKFVNR